MSELQSNGATPLDASTTAPRGRADAPRFVPNRVRTHAPGAGTADALAAARDALRRVPFSLEALRAEVVRYGAVSRAVGANGSELTDGLESALGPSLARLPAAVAAELRVHVGWWAAHGYHRAD